MVLSAKMSVQVCTVSGLERICRCELLRGEVWVAKGTSNSSTTMKAIVYGLGWGAVNDLVDEDIRLSVDSFNVMSMEKSLDEQGHGWRGKTRN